MPIDLSTGLHAITPELVLQRITQATQSEAKGITLNALIKSFLPEAADRLLKKQIRNRVLPVVDELASRNEIRRTIGVITTDNGNTVGSFLESLSVKRVKPT